MPLLDDVRLLQLTFFPLFAAGFLGMPRRVSTYAPSLQTLNDSSGLRVLLFASMLLFVYNLVRSLVFGRVAAPTESVASAHVRVAAATPVPLRQLRRDSRDHRRSVRTTASRARRQVAVL